MAKECIRSADGMQHRNYIVGNLIEYSRNEAAHPYRLTLNQKLGNLYSAGWTPIDWTERRKLGKKPLALWLHGYIASYATIYPTKVETYQKLCGSRNADIHAFRQKLKEALGTLLAEGFIKGFFSITAGYPRKINN